MEINTTATDLELYYSNKKQVYLTKPYISSVRANEPAITLVTVNSSDGRFKKDIVIYYSDIEKVNGVIPVSYNSVVLLLRNFLGV